MSVPSTPFRKEFPLIHPKHFFQSSKTLHYLGSAFGYDLYHDVESPDSYCLHLVHGPEDHEYFTVQHIIRDLLSDKAAALPEVWQLPMLATCVILLRNPASVRRLSS